jgi:fluoride ion exporter CrcB/FEX
MTQLTHIGPKRLFRALLLVGVSGGAGAVLRDLLLKFQPAANSYDWTSHIPYVLSAINLSGIYLVTRILIGPLREHTFNSETRLFWVTGFFGGYTSYSSIFVSLGAIWHLSVGASILTALVIVSASVLAGGLGLLGARK